MTPVRDAAHEQWRSDDVAWIIVGEVAEVPPTSVRCLVVGTEPLERITIELDNLTFMGAGLFGELRYGSGIPPASWTLAPHRYGFYAYERAGLVALQRLVVILEMHGAHTSGIVLPESVMDTFQYLTATMTPDQLWDIGNVLALTRDFTRDFERKDNLFGTRGLGEYD